MTGSDFPFRTQNCVDGGLLIAGPRSIFPFSFPPGFAAGRFALESGLVVFIRTMSRATRFCIGNRIQAREREITNLSVAGGKARPKNGHHARIL